MAPPSTTQSSRSTEADGTDPPMANCAKVCNETLAYCLEQGGDHVKAEHLKVMIDCVDVCTLAARLHERDSRLRVQAMEICASACKTCAETCEEFQDDEVMRLCAQACRECQQHCSR